MPEIVGRLRTPRLASAPATPNPGEMYYNTTTNTLLVWNGTAWVDALTTGGSGGVTYIGAYNPATTYHDGDYVIGTDGITYQCVKEGTVGVAPVPWTTAPPTQPVQVVTTLPTNPVNGQEVVLVDSAGVGYYIWRFVYSTFVTGNYKWIFVGGTAWSTESSSNTNINAASTWQKLSDTFPIPRNGWYSLEAYIAGAYGSASAATQLQVCAGTAAAQLGWSATVTLPVGGTLKTAGGITARTIKQITNAPTTVSVWVFSDRNDTTIAQGARIIATPFQIA